jgi:serine/threonine-protein kinase
MADDRRQQPDSTAPMGRLGNDDGAADDATRVHPDRVRAAYEDATRTMPPVASADRWAGSASVPPGGGTYQYPDAAPGAYPDDLEPQPNWLRPVLFGVIGLVLLGALLTGVWLIFTADDEPVPSTQASPPPAASPAPVTTAPTTAPATSEPPTSLAPPPTVVVPTELIGLSEEEARRRLTDAGLRVQVTRRTDATMAPGTVLEAFPGPGSEVPPGSLVRLVVAVAPEPSEPRPSGQDED